jgi:hypothetical protein
MTWRLRPPNGSGTLAPRIVASWVRMKFCPMSNSSCSLRLLDSRPSCRIGTLEASYLIMLGGVIPGGSGRRIACETAVIWASASSTLALGWRYTRVTEAPL